MGKINTIIVDDNQDSREIIAAFLKNLPTIHVVAELKDGEELLNFISSQGQEPVHLVLADIGMPKLDGMEASKLCLTFAPNLKFIFITGFDHYAVEAFNVAAVDYIVKPIQRERLYEAIQKAVTILTLEEQNQSSQVSKQSKLIVKKGKNTFYIRLDHILFIEKKGKDTMVHTKVGLFETLESLETIERSINDSSFFQTHRSFIVNLNKVLSVEASGKTYLVHFEEYAEVAHISKLKINQFQALIK
ncbi:LytR/AlgR family response regulator transcription factor [Bacillus sp. FJAT-45037]|uniref:LytR/AlgR family response regulator transcription factor n=1 Tax=Bacillus sp. FJAT-45037 TaxID=2011007 RepID=UPI000C2487A7|nr:LytTR family DNA-binding domain-containing protein [Bacillus sp. FJAT-45037]